LVTDEQGPGDEGKQTVDEGKQPGDEQPAGDEDDELDPEERARLEARSVRASNAGAAEQAEPLWVHCI
jgi:hypothetical protein